MQKLLRNIESKQTKFNNWNLISAEKGRLLTKVSEPSTSHLLFHPALTIIKIMVIVYYVGRPHFQWQWFLPLILGFKACKMHWLPLLNLRSSIITNNVLISHAQTCCIECITSVSSCLLGPQPKREIIKGTTTQIMSSDIVIYLLNILTFCYICFYHFQQLFICYLESFQHHLNSSYTCFTTCYTYYMENISQSPTPSMNTFT